MASNSESHSHESSGRFRFPSLTVDDTVASAASSSISMSSDAPRHAPPGRSREPTPTPLEESAYDWIAESSDDEHPDSIVSVDALDTVSIPDSDGTESDLESEIPSFHQAMIDTSTISSGGAGNDAVLDNSGMTARPEDIVPFPDLEADKAPEVEPVDDSSIRRHLEEYQRPIRLQGQKFARPDHLPSPFRVLFVPFGCDADLSIDIYDYAKDIIVQKLSEALVINQRLAGAGYAHSRNSKYHAFPTSGFGDPKASPDVELLPGGGVEIDLEQWSGWAVDRSQGKPRIIGFRAAEHTKNLEMPEPGTPIPRQWDLAVFYRAPYQAFPGAYTRMKEMIWRCDIPILDLVDGGYSKLDGPDQANSLCLIDSSGTSAGTRYGIPFDMFADFDPKELSLHLLHLNANPWAEPHPLNRPADDSSNTSWTCFRAPLRAKLFRTWIEDHPRAAIAILVHLVVMMAVCSSFLVSEFFPSMNVVDVQVTSTLPMGTPAIIQTTALTTKPIDSALGLPLTNTFAPTENRSSEFQAHRLGDSTVLLIPPKHFTTAKRAPTLFVKVTRGNNPETLHHEVKTVDGMYAVELAREEAWGTVNVEIWTRSRPRVQQSFDMDFGGRWANFGALSTFVWELSNTTVTSLSHFYGHVETSLQLFRHEVRDLADRRPEQMKHMKETWGELVQNSIAAYDDTLRALAKTEQTASKLARDTSKATRDLLRKAKRNGKGLVGRITGRRIKGACGGKTSRKGRVCS